MMDFPTQPPLMTFKQFLAAQDDNISDEDAIRKFNEYKVDFRRQQISDFFMQHKEEEWFRSKYHPEECVQRREEARAALKRRNDVFSKLIESGYLDGVSVDLDHSDVLVKLLDAAVILMEGGDEEDLKILDYVEEKAASQQPDGGSRSRTNSESQQAAAPAEKSAERSEPNKTPIRITFDKKERQKSESSQQEDEKEEQEEKIPEEPLQIAMEDEEGEKKEVDADSVSQKERKNSTENLGNNDKEKNEKKRKREKTDEYDYQSTSDSDNSSFSDSEPEPAPPGVEEAVRSIDPVILGGNPVSPPPGKAAELSKKESQNKGDDKDEDTKDQNGTAEPEDTKPRALHRTCSIFLRNLAPSITKQEVEAMCKKYPGFLRVALQDPQPERRFFRRGWVTFDRTVNIREICWTLTNIRLRDCEMGAIVNRELKQRVRPVNSIVAHRPVAKADIKHAANIIQNLDRKWNIWDDNEEKQDKEKHLSFGMVSKNPVLKNVTDFLVDEGSAEEDALMGESMDDNPKEVNPEVTLERDEELLKVLDKMIMYLRIVHSFDYYSAVEYPNEDEMPHRCGIVHARTHIPPNRITQNDVNEWIQKFELKTVSFTKLKLKLDAEEAVKLGKKNTDAELEKFVAANTQELAKDKWLCPLSGKKFKGPEFVRKHIFNKQADKVEEVKKEVTFFNNYLMDPKRPQLPEHPANKPNGPHNRGDGNFNMPPGGGYQGPPQGMMGYNQMRGPPMMYGNRRGNRRGGFASRGHEPYRHDQWRDRFPPMGRRERTRADPRGIIEYRDLDAPDDIDIF